MSDVQYLIGFIQGVAVIVILLAAAIIIEWLKERCELKRRMIRASVELAERAVALHRQGHEYDAVKHPDVQFDVMQEMAKGNPAAEAFIPFFEESWEITHKEEKRDEKDTDAV